MSIAASFLHKWGVQSAFFSFFFPMTSRPEDVIAVTSSPLPEVREIPIALNLILKTPFEREFPPGTDRNSDAGSWLFMGFCCEDGDRRPNI